MDNDPYGMSRAKEFPLSFNEEKSSDCNAEHPGPDHYTCDLPAGHTGDHFGGNSGGAAASWPQEPSIDGVMRAQYKCPWRQLTVLVDPIDYEIVSNRIVKIKFCPLCRSEHHLRTWSE